MNSTDVRPVGACFHFHFLLLQLNQKNMTLSNRCRIFDKFQDRISQHAIKIDFLNKIHRKHPPNRRLAKPVKRKNMKVCDILIETLME